jgi:dTDP-4-amino-4,6-dideoxygalactose transaminase
LASTIIQALGAAGYEVRGSYVPIHLLGVFHRCVWDRLPQTERLWADLIELPCEPSVSLNDVERISSVIKKFTRSHSASLHCQDRAGISTKPNGLC